MFCKFCGTQIPEGENVCPECGSVAVVLKPVKEGHSIQTDSGKTIIEPEQVIIEPEQVIVEPEQIVIEPEQVIVEPEQVVVEPEQTAAEPAQMLSEPMQPAIQPKAKKSLGELLAMWQVKAGILAGALIILAAIVVGLIFAFSGSSAGYLEYTNGAVAYAGGVVFNEDGDSVKVEPGYTGGSNQNGDLFLMVKNEGLYMLDKKDLSMIAVTSGLKQVLMGNEGEYFLYFSNGTYSANTYETVYDIAIYDVKGQTATRIDSEVSLKHCVISPKGNIVCYAKPGDTVGNYDLYYGGLDGSSIRIAEHAFPVAVSDEGKGAIFYQYDTGALNYFDGRNTVSVAKEVSADRYTINSRGNEILYAKNGDTYFYEMGAGRPIMLSSNTAMVFPKPNIHMDDAHCGDCTYAHTANSFKGKIYYDSITKCLCFLDEDGEQTAKIADKVNEKDIFVSKDGKSAVYRGTRDGIYKVEDAGLDTRGGNLLWDKPFTDICVSEDLEDIYFTDEMSKLCYLKSFNTCEVIDDGSCYAMQFQGDTLYFLSGGDLFSTTGTAKSKKRQATQVDGLQWVYGYTCYASNQKVYKIDGNRSRLIYEPEE